MRKKKALKSDLRQKAESAWRFFAWGFPCPFETREEAQQCWEIIRAETMARYRPIGSIDEHGSVELGPWGFWCFDYKTPWYFETPPGIDHDNFQRHCKYLALREWGMLDPAARDEGLEGLRRTLDYLQNIYSRGRDQFSRPWTTVEAKLDIEWQAIAEKIVAYRDYFAELEGQ